MKNGVWRSLVACWCWVPKVEGSNPSTPKKKQSIVTNSVREVKCKITRTRETNDGV